MMTYHIKKRQVPFSIAKATIITTTVQLFY